MKKLDWKTLLLAVLTGLIANILSVEYQNCRLAGDSGNKNGLEHEPHVMTVSYNDTLSAGRIQSVKIIVDVKLSR